MDRAEQTRSGGCACGRTPAPAAHAVGAEPGRDRRQAGPQLPADQKYERGTNRIGASRLYRLSKVLGVPVTFFFEDMPMGVVAASKHRAAALADDAIPTPREIRMLVRVYSRLPAAPVRRHMVGLIKAVAWACSDG